MLTWHMLTNPGGREHNEDCINMCQGAFGYCFVLADGLGGHGSGEVASKLAADEVVRTFLQTGEAGEASLPLSMGNAQQAILRAQEAHYHLRDMKTTCVILSVERSFIRWAHIGDSRLYYFKDGKLISRTLDHSVPQMLVLAGRIKEKQIRNHPDRNRLLRVMGAPWNEPRYEVAEPVKREDRQAFLLCSDGFWELIDEKKMTACLKHAKDVRDWALEMEKVVLKNGRKRDMDNYSAITVWVE